MAYLPPDKFRWEFVAHAGDREGVAKVLNCDPNREVTQRLGEVVHLLALGRLKLVEATDSIEREPIDAVKQWLIDGHGLYEVMRFAESNWGYTRDDAFRLIDKAMLVVDVADQRHEHWARLKDRVDTNGSLRKSISDWKSSGKKGAQIW